MAVIEITTKVECENACLYCPQSKFITAYTKRSNMLQMSLDVFKACVDKVPVNVNIHFSGMCEPWLNPECTKMVLYAYEKGHKITAATTLVGMCLRDIDLLESVSFKKFSVHLPSEEGYEGIGVDKNYLELLDRIFKSNIEIRSCRFHGQELHPKVKALVKNNTFPSDIRWSSGRVNNPLASTRAGNIRIKGRTFQRRKQGIIRCVRNLRWNVLLPNGEVILCCMDYGMQHILGNLILTDYESLFRSEDFLGIQKGLSDESLDILCRYCDRYVYIA